MAILKIDPPPNTNDIATLRNYISDLYDAINNVVYNLDKDNMSEEFINMIGTNKKNGEE